MYKKQTYFNVTYNIMIAQTLLPRNVDLPFVFRKKQKKKPK